MIVGLEAMHVILQKKSAYILPCPKHCEKNKINSCILISMTEEISRQSNIQAIALVILAAFSQINSANQGQKTEKKNEQLNFGREGTHSL